MDPLTHTLVGAALARTRIARGIPRADLTLMVAANLPDIDAFCFVAGTDAAMGFRRGWTHGPLAALLLPAVWVLVLLVLPQPRPGPTGCPPPSPLRLLGWSYLGCLSHPLLDLLNTYGVRLLMPFDERWFYGDAVFIIDPWLWLVLGGALYCGAPRRGVPWGWLALAISTSLIVLLAGETVPRGAQAAWLAGLACVVLLSGSSRLAWYTERVATTALTLALIYVGAMTTLTTIGSNWVREELDRQGVAGVSRLMVGPMPANPFRWDVLAETPTAYRHGAMSWLPERSLDLDPRPIERTRPSPVVDAALADPQIQGTLSWMRFPYLEVEETVGGYVVHVLDARYVRTRRTGFGTIRVTLDRELRVE